MEGHIRQSAEAEAQGAWCPGRSYPLKAGQITQESPGKRTAQGSGQI